MAARLDFLRHGIWLHFTVTLCLLGSGGLFFWYHSTHSFDNDNDKYREKLYVMDDDAKRAFLHGVLKNPFARKPDAVNELREIGDKESIPLLIKAFSPGYFARLDKSIEKSRAGSILALLTNHDFGEDQQAWEGWWRTVHDNSLNEIQLKGFQKDGFLLTSSPNVETCRALITASALQESRYHRGAHSVLNTYPREIVEAVLTTLATSKKVDERLEAVRFLGMHWFQHSVRRRGTLFSGRDYSPEALRFEAKLLRMLSKDSVQSVRRYALAKLNQHLVATQDFEEEIRVVATNTFKARIYAVVPGADATHVLLMESSNVSRGEEAKRRILYFDLERNTENWSHGFKARVESEPLLNRDTVYLCLDARILCLDVHTGKPKQEIMVPIDTEISALSKIVLADDLIVTASNDFLFAFRQDDGELSWKTPLSDEWTVTRKGETQKERNYIASEKAREKEDLVERMNDLEDAAQARRLPNPERTASHQHGQPENDLDSGCLPVASRNFDYVDGYLYVQKPHDTLLKIDGRGRIVDALSLFFFDSLDHAEEKGGKEDVPQTSNRPTQGVTHSQYSFKYAGPVFNDRVLYSDVTNRRQSYLRAYSTDSFELLWSKSLAAYGNLRGIHATKNNLIYASGPLTGALDKNTTKEVWSDPSRFQNIQVLGDHLISREGWHAVTVRSAKTGEVILSLRLPSPKTPPRERDECPHIAPSLKFPAIKALFLL
jgi:hypothetical protein